MHEVRLPYWMDFACRVLSRASQRYQLELGILPADGLEPPHIGTPRKSRATASKTISVSGCGERMATLEEHLSSMSQELVRRYIATHLIVCVNLHGYNSAVICAVLLQQGIWSKCRE